MGLSIHLPGSDKRILFDIAFGGNFFALVDATQLGLKIHPGNSAKLIQFGMLLRKLINQEMTINHPLFPEMKSVDLVEFYEPCDNKNFPTRNAVVFGDHQLDRSPCGTGTCAKMALLAEKGLLAPGERFTSESIIGTHFTGWVEPGSSSGQDRTWIPFIQGRSYITGLNQLVAEEGDPFVDGFLLSRE